MKKDLRGYGRGEQRPNYESMAQNAMNSADPEQLKSMEDAMNYYGGKSEGELMEELMRGKSSGMIDEAKLNDVAARIAPMLTPEQLSRLSAVMERLRQEKTPCCADERGQGSLIWTIFGTIYP